MDENQRMDLENQVTQACSASEHTLRTQNEDSDALLLEEARLLRVLELVNLLGNVLDNASISRNNARLISILNRIRDAARELNENGRQQALELVSVVYTKGRPKLMVGVDLLTLMRKEGMMWRDIAGITGLSTRTLERRRKEMNFQDPQLPSIITDDELDNKIRLLVVQNPGAGSVMISGALRSHELHVHRSRIRDSIRRVDPWGVFERCSTLIPRRKYRVAGPNSLWHIDGNHKMIAWGFVIHGCIDGYSRLIVFLKCNTNNRAETMLRCFVEGAQELGGIPSRVRGDRGCENVDIARYMEDKRGPNRGSFIHGRSVHNIRIERLWRDVTRQVSRFFKDIFLKLEDDGFLDAHNRIHLFCLHWIYLEKINRALNYFVAAWNNHGLRTEHNRSPRALYTSGLFANGPRGADISLEDIPHYGIDPDGPLPEDVRDEVPVVVPDLDIPFDETDLASLKDRFPASESDMVSGMDEYKNMVHFVTITYAHLLV